MGKIKAFVIPGWGVIMHTRESVNEPPHFNARNADTDLKIWINTTTENNLDYQVVRSQKLRSGRAAIDSKEEKLIAGFVHTYRKELLEQWESQLRPQQQNDLGRGNQK